MNTLKKIRTCLISVFHKTNLDEIVQTLKKLDVQFISTGGTFEYLENQGVNAIKVEDLTSFPAILGGRVKTLHPQIFGGILARRENPDDLATLQQYQIPEIDLVIVDLYPFAETIAAELEKEEIQDPRMKKLMHYQSLLHAVAKNCYDGSEDCLFVSASSFLSEESIEKIDIGGISLIRAAAKNFKDVLVVGSKRQYYALLKLLQRKNGVTDIEDRQNFATIAFDITSHYDSLIFQYFCSKNPSISNTFKLSIENQKHLRYGENPHQHAHFYGDLNSVFEQIQGKEISYNNLLDIEAAIGLISEFENEPTFAILKHNNPCGCASGATILEAWERSFAGDTISAFGGILISNKEIDKETALSIDKIFFEVLLAPSFSDESLEILKQKQNRILLILKPRRLPYTQYRSMFSGVLVQTRDFRTEKKENMKFVTQVSPSESEIEDLIFANKIVKYSKSNAIVLVRNKQLIGSGVGQTSRIDAVRQSIEKAKSFNFDLKDAVLASDAFFPFSDSVEAAYNAGITAIIQPGGSVKDNESIDFCNKQQISMVFTGIRHFKH